MSPPSHHQLREQIAQCERDGAFLRSLVELYADVDRLVASIPVSCRACGRCCDFAVSGVRLYASTGEFALLTRAGAPDAGACIEDRCPYQIGGKCGARERRPLGCRIFFCKRGFSDALEAQYEAHHRAIRILHQTHCLPYAYADLVDACLQLSSRK